MIKVNKWLKPHVVLFLLFPVIAFADVSVDWLGGQSNPDGSNSLPTDVATSYQSTAESVRAYLDTENLPPAGISEPLSFINSDTFQSTEYLSRKIIINAKAGSDVAASVSELMGYRNADGGFGELPGYTSTVIDTAFALEALALSGNTSGSVAGYAVGYLFNKQAPDGSWRDQGNESYIYTTALVVQALTPYKSIYSDIPNVIDAGVNYLLSQRDQSFLWEETYLSAQALIAILPNLLDVFTVQESIDGFIASQEVNGSWAGDVYQTALGLRALSAIEVATADPTLGAIRGVVVDAQTNLPLAGVNVGLSGQTSSSDLTDSYGNFSFNQIAAGGYSFTFSLNGYSELTATASVSQGETITLGAVSLSKGATPTTGTVQGVFTHAGTSAALSGVTVLVQGTDLSAITTADGSYQIINVPVGGVTLQAEKSGYSAATVSTSITAGGLAIFSSSLTPVTTPITAIEGVVTDADTHQPIPGVTISLSGATTASGTSDSNGAYRIEGLNPGSLTITVSAAGYDAVLASTTVYENNIIKFSPAMYGVGTTPGGSNTAGVSGVVVDAATNLPIEGAEIIATFGSSSQSLVSDSIGGFTISGLTDFSGELLISKAGYTQHTIGLSLEPLTVLDLGSIRLNSEAGELLPDLIAQSIDTVDAVNDPHTLEISGQIIATIENAGNSAADQGVEVLVFHDSDNSGRYENGIDELLGKANTTINILPGNSEDINVMVDGYLPFRGAPIKVWVDSGQKVVELDESNNIKSSSSYCVTSLEGDSSLGGISVKQGYVIEEYVTNVTTQSGPTALAVNSAGDLYVAPGDTGSPIKIPFDTRVPESFGLVGTTDSDGVAVDSDGNVILSGDQVIKYDLYGNAIWSNNCPVDNVQLVTTDVAGNVFAGSQGSQICMISADGSNVSAFGEFTFPSDPVVGPDGYLYIGQYSAGGFVKVNPISGAVIEEISPLKVFQPVFDNNGDIYFINGDALYKLEMPGKQITIIASGFSRPRSLAINSNNEVFVGDTKTKDIYKIKSNSAADLTVSTFVVSNSPLSLSVRVGNAGEVSTPDQVEVAFYEGDPNAGGLNLGSVNIGPIQAGEFADIRLENPNINGSVDLYAVVDATDKVVECNETNNVISIPGPTLYPDLVPAHAANDGISTDPQTLNVSGDLKVTVENTGTLAVSAGVEILAFYDANMNEVYDTGVDTSLGSSDTNTTLNIASSEIVSIPVTGELPFRDAPISVWVDSANSVLESSEVNNIGITSSFCKGDEPEIGQIQPVQKWRWGKENVLTIPLVGPLIDTNGDGRIDDNDEPIVVFASHSGFVDGNAARLRTVNGRTGEEIWSVTASSLLTDASAHPALGDIDGDGIPEIVMYRYYGGVVAINNDGSTKWISNLPPDPGYYNYGGISLADIDGDGNVEIFARNHILNSDGSIRWVAPVSTGHYVISYAADMDMDGTQEIIIGSRIYRIDGSDYWDNSNKGNSFSVVANFDNDPYPEMVVKSSRYQISLLDHDGSHLWTSAIPGRGGGAPTVSDLDGDGMPEIGIAGGSYYAVYNHDGSLLWSSRISDSSQSTGSTAFDFDGDGKTEIVYSDQAYLRIYDGATGNVVYQISHGARTATEYPVVADIDGDNHAEILVVGDANSSTRGVRALEDANDSWVATRRIWNQYAYHIDNVNDDGTIPKNPSHGWLTHNSFRLNAFPNRAALDQPDLTISKLVITDNGFGQPLTLSATIGNAGLAGTSSSVQIAFYDGDPLNSGVLLGTIDTSMLGAGGYRDIQLTGVASISGTQMIYAVVDANEAYPECNESNNQTSTLPGLSAAGTISVATNAAGYGPNNIVLLNGGISNTSALNGNFIAQLQLEDANGGIVTSFTPHAANGVVGGGSATIGDAWNTGSILAGTYVLRGILSLTDGTILDVSTSTFTISQGDPSLPAATLRTTTDLPVYHTTATVQLQNLIQNSTTNTIIDNTVLKLVVTGPTGTQVFSTENDLGQLGISAQRGSTTPYSFEAAAVGQYTVSAELWDSVNNMLLASDTAQYQVENDLNAALNGQVTSLLPELYVGDEQLCTNVVTNVGNLELTGLNLRSVLVDMDQQLEVESQAFSTDLALAQAFTNDYQISTHLLIPGAHACILQAEIGGIWQNLANAVFTVLPNPNTAPVADAGFDQHVALGEHVTLDASASTDVDGNELSYHWTMIGSPLGSTAILSDITAVMPTFDVDLQGSYVYQLIVNDGTVNSEPDTVIINVGNVAPVANAGADRHAMPGDTVQLDGSASTDVDGDTLSFQWSIVESPVGGAAILSDVNAIMPEINIDLDGRYALQLVVSDGELTSDRNTVVLSTYNLAPIADAGLDRTINTGDTITLDGSGSSDANGDLLGYRWSLINVPDGSIAVLLDETTLSPSITFDLSGIYIAQLIVNDAELDSLPDAVVLNVENIRPVANAGPDLSLSAGSLLSLDGSASFDADNDLLNYQWYFTTLPDGASPLIDNASGIMASYSSYIAGLYVGQLIVDDGTLASEPDTAVINVIDDVGPITRSLMATPNPVDIHTSITLTALVDDSKTGGADIQSAEYRIDDGAYMPMVANDALFDSMSESVTTSLPAFGQTGVYQLCVRGTDALGNTGADECMLLAVYDPEGGFVTGGGWIDSPAGACRLTVECATAIGKANFGFNSKYKKGAKVPTGNTNFVFKDGGIHFKSNSYDWLVVAGAKAKYKGVGTINGTGDYGFMISAIDAKLTNSTDRDLFRIKIWDRNDADRIVYDNEIGKDENGDPTTAIGGGSIVIHK